VHATRERRLACGGPPAPPLRDPRRYRVLVGPGLAAQRRGLAYQRLIKLTLAGALEDPGHLSKEVRAAARELAQRGHRGGFIVAAEFAPPSAVARLPRQLRDEDTVSLRTPIDHAF